MMLTCRRQPRARQARAHLTYACSGNQTRGQSIGRPTCRPNPPSGAKLPAVAVQTAVPYAQQQRAAELTLKSSLQAAFQGPVYNCVAAAT